jgi:cytoskeletal protein RodZ
MTEPQEFDSIDALFRQKFKDLPESSAANGWDTPSDRVWEHVRTHMPKPRTGWSRRNWTLVGAVAVSIALGLYWFSISSVPEQPAQIVAPAVASPAQTPAPATEQAPPPAIDKPEQPAAQSPKSAAAPKRQNKVSANPARPSDTLQTPRAAPSTAKQPAFPNNAARRRAEAQQKLWETPLELLPLVIEKKKN